MAALEQRCQDVYGIDTGQLMEAAGRRTAEVARRLLRSAGGRRCLVLAGKGNNGGDGMVAARHLVGDGPTRVLFAAALREIPERLAARLEDLRRAHVPVEEAGALSASGIGDAMRDADLIVDAIFGTGFRGPARGVPAQMIEAANASGVPILAVDVPSGVDASTGRAEAPCIRAAATVTLALPKAGLVQYPAASYAGRLFVADIGLPEPLIREAPVPTSLATAAWVCHTIPPRPADAHKGRFGRVAVVGGARGFGGAPILAARGAIRAGAGLVTIGLPSSLAPSALAALPEAMTRPLAENSAGTLTDDGFEGAHEFAAEGDVVALGPGLSTHPDTVALIRRLLPGIARPIVLDADGLNAFAGDAERLRQRGGALVITPHPGEMARLLGREIGEIQHDRLAAAREAAKVCGAVALLKGARTIVACPEGRAAVIPTGNPAMATGGMGDVLTGVIAALLGSGLPPFEAASCGAYLHGLAGDLAAGSLGEFGLLAHEVADSIPRAMARVRSGEVNDGIVPIP
jgi:ADP-dependent NAD(P)H-hydrate dehydratase / NAD(P)H-hydrate epimerase